MADSITDITNAWNTWNATGDSTQLQQQVNSVGQDEVEAVLDAFGMEVPSWFPGQGGTTMSRPSTQASGGLPSSQAGTTMRRPESGTYVQVGDRIYETRSPGIEGPKDAWIEGEIIEEEPEPKKSNALWWLLAAGLLGWSFM